MLLTNVTRQLKAILPYYTNLFSDTNKIEDYSYLNTILAIKTSNPHGLQVGDFIIIKGMQSKYIISNLIYNSQTGVLTATLPPAHEIFNTDKVLTLKGFSNNTFNGEFSIIRLDDLTIQLQLPTNLATPTVTNLEIVIKELVFDANSMFKVANIINETEFIINTWIFNPNYDVSNAYILTSRVSATAEDPENLIASETKNRSFMYVTLSQIQINKKSPLDFSKSEDRFMVGDEITIYAILPCKKDPTGYATTDLMRNEVFYAINKAILYGSFDPKQPNRELTVSEVIKVSYAKSQLTYAFKYILPREVIREDGFDRVLERRFRELDMDVIIQDKSVQAVIDMFKN